MSSTGNEFGESHVDIVESDVNQSGSSFRGRTARVVAVVATVAVLGSAGAYRYQKWQEGRRGTGGGPGVAGLPFSGPNKKLQAHTGQEVCDFVGGDATLRHLISAVAGFEIDPNACTPEATGGVTATYKQGPRMITLGVWSGGKLRLQKAQEDNPVLAVKPAQISGADAAYCTTFPPPAQIQLLEVFHTDEGGRSATIGMQDATLSNGAKPSALLGCENGAPNEATAKLGAYVAAAIT